MNLCEISSKEYKLHFKTQLHVFNSAEFNELNKNKTEYVKYILFKKGNKPKFGIVLGIKKQCCDSPFSSPFGGFCFKKEPTIEDIDNIIDLLLKYCKENQLKKIKIVLPPIIYNTSFITKCINSFLNNKFEISYMDLNYSINTGNLKNIDNYLQKLGPSGKKNYNRAIQSGLIFEKQNTTVGYEEAYKIIKHNRKIKKKPLNMSYEDICKTMKIIEVDFFLVKKDNLGIASAVVFHINKNVVQVVYWGDVEGFANFRPMNFLAFQLTKYYLKSNICIIDLGYSTEKGIPNYGLCNFKENIGASADPKFTFEINI